MVFQSHRIYCKHHSHRPDAKKISFHWNPVRRLLAHHFTNYLLLFLQPARISNCFQVMFQNSPAMRQANRRISKRVLQENKARHIFRKKIISCLLIRKKCKECFTKQYIPKLPFKTSLEKRSGCKSRDVFRTLPNI